MVASDEEDAQREEEQRQREEEEDDDLLDRLERKRGGDGLRMRCVSQPHAHRERWLKGVACRSAVRSILSLPRLHQRSSWPALSSTSGPSSRAPRCAASCKRLLAPPPSDVQSSWYAIPAGRLAPHPICRHPRALPCELQPAAQTALTPVAQSSLAKSYVGELVETARETMTAAGETGPLQPRHIRGAQRQAQRAGTVPHCAIHKRRLFWRTDCGA